VGVTREAILRKYKKYKVESTKETGGKQMYIPIGHLESEVQEKLKQFGHPHFKQHMTPFGEVRPQAPQGLPAVVQNLTQLTDCPNDQVIPDAAKKEASAKYDLINYWKEFSKGKSSKTQADKDFIEFYNSGTLSQTLLDILGQKSLKTLYKWKKELEDGGGNILVLVPKYNYTSDLKCNTKMTDIEKQIFTDIMLKNNKVKVGRAYEYVKFRLSEQGITEISSQASYRRLWQFLNKKHHTQVVFAREGEKAARETMPSIMRDASSFEVGDVLVADGHTVDFDLINPYTGKAQRMTLIGFIDWASRDIMGWEIMPTENTQAIASAFRNAVMRLGKIPKVVYLDNGKAFRGKFFSGCESLKSAGLDGLYKSLGIKVKYTEAYNGQAKIIERFFREFTESFAIMQNSYRGNSIDNKPAYLMRNEKFHLSLKGNLQPPTVQEFKQSFEDWLDNIYRQRPGKNDKSATIAECFARGKGAGVCEDLLNDFIMAQDVRTVTKDGIRMFNTFYWCDEILGIKDKVTVRYSLFDLTKLKVFSMKGIYIGTAKTRTLVHGMAAELGTEIDYTTFKTELKAQKDRKKAHLTGVKTWLKQGARQVKAVRAKEIKTIQAKEVLQLPKKQTIYDFTDITVYQNIEMPKVREL
jgi:putative transposase